LGDFFQKKLHIRGGPVSLILNQNQIVTALVERALCEVEEPCLSFTPRFFGSSEVAESGVLESLESILGPMTKPAKTFKDLVVWQKAHRFVLATYLLTASFPKSEIYCLTSQMRR